MLPPQNRMRSRLDFTETVRTGRRAGRSHVVVHLLAGGCGTAKRRAVAEPVSPIVGLIVGKQVGGSVVRKRVSRRLRAAMAPVLQECPPSARLVVRALPSSATAEVSEFERQLRSAVFKLVPPAPAPLEKSDPLEKGKR
ncbi:MAG: ribonuclease P protein component [Segniliparus sp.]|uniref:ribonuclease P protein component n=1 Tax=Segniliparus sp. TaxID=2804064 RepID=UPI003F2A2F83